MPSFTNAAYIILAEHGTPLSAGDITKVARRSGMIVTKGKTPSQTMQASLYSESKRRLARGEVPRFKQYEKRLWGLSNWA